MFSLVRGGSRIFFRRGCTRLLLYFNTNKPHSFFFSQNTSCIRKPQVISGGGGAHPLHPPPRSAPACYLGSINCFIQYTNFNIYLLFSYAVLLISNIKSNKVSKINAWLLLVSHQVNMNVCGEFLSLEVPGLSEGRPSLLLGDRVVASLSGLLQVIVTTFDVQSAIFLFLNAD